MSKHKYTWRPDVPDYRDWKFQATKVARPSKVDLRSGCSKVEDQGDLGSCTANALVGALEYLENKDQVKFTDLSRLFVYYNERLIDGDVSEDAGSSLRTGIKALIKYGAATELLWPYVTARFTLKPSTKIYADGATRKVSSYYRLSSLNDMLDCLAIGYPFVFGFSVYDAFESDEVAKTGVLNMPTKGESNLGGHAVLAVGYDMASKRFIVRNSWGSNWGLKGYFTIPFDYLTNRDLSDDFWKIMKVINL